uniref:Uncharacterized protein n=1 Tax=Kalanchoe fedtschenkoi TaxID=63787 RepID=A0A7N0TIV8_KALFE
MTLCYPSTPAKKASTLALFVTGAGLFYIGLHYSHVNVAPLQAKTKARNDYVKERLKQKYGYVPPRVYDRSTWKDPREMGRQKDGV